MIALSMLLTLSTLVHAPALAGVPTRLADDPERGKELYMRDCTACHGRRALGDGPIAAALATPPPALAGRIPEADFDDAVRVIRFGLADMPGYAETLSKKDTRRVLIWLATLDPETGRGPAKKGALKGKSGDQTDRDDADNDDADE